MPDSPTTVARRLYDAMATHDATALVDLLSDDFEGLVSAGMPHAVGGPRHGRDAMLGVWGTVDALYDIAVEPHEFLEVSNERVVVIGRYRGRARTGDTAVDAAFAHVIDVRGERLSGLHQITDTARWGVRLAT